MIKQSRPTQFFDSPMISGYKGWFTTRLFDGTFHEKWIKGKGEIQQSSADAVDFQKTIKDFFETNALFISGEDASRYSLKGATSVFEVAHWFDYKKGDKNPYVLSSKITGKKVPSWYMNDIQLIDFVWKSEIAVLGFNDNSGERYFFFPYLFTNKPINLSFDAKTPNERYGKSLADMSFHLCQVTKQIIDEARSIDEHSSLELIVKRLGDFMSACLYDEDFPWFGKKSNVITYLGIDGKTGKASHKNAKMASSEEIEYLLSHFAD